MKWNEMRESNNVEDRRGIPGGAGSVGIGTALVAVVLGLIFGVSPLQVLNFLQGNQGVPTSQTSSQPINDRDSAFVKSVLGDTEDTWDKIFSTQLKRRYEPPKLVLFNNGVNSGCGSAQTATGPFYCPSDRKVYLDLGFFEQVQATAGTNSDFARSYAIAHEVGHHVQTTLGISAKVRQAQANASPEEANALSVRQELQADCFAGLWAYYTAQRGLINEQDVAGALNTATQIGDDYLQKRSRGYAVPDSFTHGSSQQRVSWFTRGLKSGDIDQCNTFASP
ncbi:KPN_02809 family neutral zinc metallopeptidase [Merismopedia glauca]|uniref:Neutral zinc metallopeptidase n=1 Tax=Merismopedia glauca CCAP 1448/3 TaxID=1296344 RepID=A0A2T1C1W8_9CYAN|nr:neutral zinc metallopeptidase [Merismopedia glauca]PSB02270.1 neutral zinc metallopeptidase [Merismopedia glauca CCAP 1448/3]